MAAHGGGARGADAGTLWVTRIVLLAAVLGHVVSAVVLTRRAHRARPVRYAHAAR